MSQNLSPDPAGRAAENGAARASFRESEASRRAAIPLDEIAEAIRSIRYGTVQIIIQDGFVIQIDKTEKVRLR